MAFDGNGNFLRIYNWQTDKANGVKIRADRMDGEDDNFAQGLSSVVTRDGQSPATANLPMGGFAHTGVGAASLRTMYLRASQAQDNDLTYFTTAGTINAYTLTPSPAITSLTAGQEWLIKIHAACAAAPTLNVSGLGAATIVYADGSAVPASGLVADGQYRVRYDGTNYRLGNTASLTLGLTDGGTLSGAGTVAVNNKYLCDYTSTSYTITLPASPTTGDFILLTKFGTFVMTLGLNSLKFNGVTTNPSSAGEGQSLLRYTGSSRGWVEL